MSKAASRRSVVRRTGWVVLVAASLAVAGCARATMPEATEADGSAAATPTPTPTREAVPWPLTGLPMDDETIVRPALNVKIENDKSVRPQTGLEFADIVWEEVVEGGITRFVVVYHSQVPEVVGPVRSNRPMDPKIAGPSRGLIAFSGGMYTGDLRAAGLQAISMDEGAPGFYRNHDFKAPHNVFGTPQEWWDVADSKHGDNPPAQFAYAPTAAQATAATAGKPAASVDVSLSPLGQPSWSWDAASKTWLRSEGTTPSSSRAGTRLAATNVIVLKVQIVNTKELDPAGTPVPDTKLEGTGEALIATGGKVVTATWTKGSQTDPLVLTTADGTTVTLAPGITWVELMPTERSWTIS